MRVLDGMASACVRITREQSATKHMSIPKYRIFRDQPSFPTRRSSDLVRAKLSDDQQAGYCLRLKERFCPIEGQAYHFRRSEEHTSELQSRLHLVCRLLLEKKKERPPLSRSARS